MFFCDTHDMIIPPQFEGCPMCLLDLAMVEIGRLAHAVAVASAEIKRLASAINVAIRLVNALNEEVTKI